MPRRMTGCRDSAQPVAEISFDGQAQVGGIGPRKGAQIAPIYGPGFGAFSSGQDDRAAEQGQGSDVINMAMGQDQMGDIGGDQTQQRQLASGGLAGRKIYQFTEPRQVIAGIGCGVICGICGIKAGIDQNARAVIGFQQEPRYADGALAGAHIEGAEIKDVKADDVMGGESQVEAFLRKAMNKVIAQN